MTLRKNEHPDRAKTEKLRNTPPLPWPSFVNPRAKKEGFCHVYKLQCYPRVGVYV
jgi:hypothetical protein